MIAQSVHTIRQAHYNAIRLMALSGNYTPNYAKSQALTPRAIVSARKGLSLRGTTAGTPSIRKPRKPLLDAMSRRGLKVLRDDQVRATLSHAQRVSLASEYVKPMTALRGVPAIPTSEARYSERGASGIKGVKGSFASVSMRDAKAMGRDGLHDSLLKQLNTVGVATYYASGKPAHASHVTAAIAVARTDWKRSALTVRQSRVPFAVWATGAHIYNAPVTQYLVVADTRKQAKRAGTTSAVVVTQAQRDVVLAASIGTIHEAS